MLFGEERKMKIIEYVQEYSRASVQELSQYFQVSEATIRRDLKDLEKAKLLKRTHGGVVSNQLVNFEPTILEKQDKFRSQKEAIAKKAVELIEDGDTILLDSGTTTFHMAKELGQFNKLTIVTNSLSIAQELVDFQGVDVLIIGGDLRHKTLALVGPIAEKVLSMVRVDKAFIATNGLDLKEGLTTPNLTEAATKKKMVEVAKQVNLLVDHSKVGKVTFAKFARLDEIDQCITDSNVPEGVVKEMEKQGIKVYVVKE